MIDRMTLASKVLAFSIELCRDLDATDPHKAGVALAARLTETIDDFVQGHTHK